MQCLGIILIIKGALRLVLHIQKLCDSSFIPAEFAQVFAATALVNLQEERGILAGCRAQGK